MEARMCLRSFLLILTTLLTPVLSFLDLGHPQSFYSLYQTHNNNHNNHNPRPTPARPIHLPPEWDLQYDDLPSHITAIAPSTTMAANGSIETMFSIHFNDFIVRKRQGKGTFDKRGVFANDPPIATCTPCNAVGYTTFYNDVSISATAVCTTHVYNGVFRSGVGVTANAKSTYCFGTSYTGVFQVGTTSSTGLPCCFTIPESCRANYSSTMTNSWYTYTSGVFRSTTFISNVTSTSTQTASPSSSSAVTTASLTSGSRSSSASASNLATKTILTSGSSSSSLSSSLNSLTTRLSSYSSSSSIATSTSSSFDPSTSSSSSKSGLTPSSVQASSSISSLSSSFSSSLPPSKTPSLTVISSLTVTDTLSASTSNAGGLAPRPGVQITSTSQVTLAVVTAKPTRASIPPYITIVPNTVHGCGTASGSGTVIGSGVVYIGPFAAIPITSSGTVSGSAALVVGCGTIIATSGSFSGSATVIGCGEGSGSATLIGSGTVYPVLLGGLVGITSSGTVIGSGRVRGCGTIIGSGTFSATAPYTKTVTSPPEQTTVSVYLSYCPGAGVGMPRLAGNASGPASLNYTQPSNGRVADDTTALDGYSGPEENLCKPCANDVGICCPTQCTDAGHCPWSAMRGAGFVRAGLNIVAEKNSTGRMPGFS